MWKPLGFFLNLPKCVVEGGGEWYGVQAISSETLKMESESYYNKKYAFLSLNI